MTSRRASGARRQPKEETRRQILATARDLVAEQGVPERADIRLSEVLTEMGLTSGAAYNIWESQEAFQRELALHILSDYSWAGYGKIGGAELDVTAEEPYDELRRMTDGYIASLTTHQAFFTALRFWGVREPSDELRAAIQTGYRMNDPEWRSFYELGLGWAGRRMREPFTLDDLVTAVKAATEGAAVRGRFDPDALTGSSGQPLGGEMVVAIVDWFTERVDGSDETTETSALAAPAPA